MSPRRAKYFMVAKGELSSWQLWDKMKYLVKKSNFVFSSLLLNTENTLLFNWNFVWGLSLSAMLGSLDRANFFIYFESQNHLTFLTHSHTQKRNTQINAGISINICFRVLQTKYGNLCGPYKCKNKEQLLWWISDWHRKDPMYCFLLLVKGKDKLIDFGWPRPK